ncbi:MAG: LemA family protein [Acetivibrionales bacterium]|jgi:LemA protein
MNHGYNSYIWSRRIKIGIVVLVAAILIISSISTYNGLVVAEQDVQSKWAQVENVMQRRADLIINEVETVKGYIQHEEKVFSKIAEARSKILNEADDIASANNVLQGGSADVADKLQAYDRIVSAGRSILFLVENYPELKASEHFTNLQEQIEGSENRVSVERKRFIESVQAYNTRISRFPGNIFARLMGFKPMDYFEASSEAKEAPKVKF